MTHNTSTHVHNPDPPQYTSELQAQREAKKARLKRFAEAASRYQAKGQTLADIRQSAILERYIESQPRLRRDYETANRPSPYMPIARRILLAVGREFDMPVERITAKSNEAKYCLPRFVAIGLMLETTRLSLPAIGTWLGGRDHSTIISGRRRIYGLLESEAFRNRFDQIKAAVQG